MSKNQTKFVILLDYTGGTLIKIKLTEEELEKSLEHEDFEVFLTTLEAKYEFRLRDCEWMSVNEITEREYGM